MKVDPPSPIRHGNWYIIDGELVDVPLAAPVAEASETSSEPVEVVTSSEPETQTESEPNAEVSSGWLSRITGR